MVRAVKFQLTNPGALMDLLRQVLEYLNHTPGGSPCIYQNEAGDLRYNWSKSVLDGRRDVSLGYATFRRKDGVMVLHGPFFEDCEDEVLDVCAQLGAKAKVASI